MMYSTEDDDDVQLRNYCSKKRISSKGIMKPWIAYHCSIPTEQKETTGLLSLASEQSPLPEPHMQLLRQSAVHPLLSAQRSHYYQQQAACMYNLRRATAGMSGCARDLDHDLERADIWRATLVPASSQGEVDAISTRSSIIDLKAGAAFSLVDPHLWVVSDLQKSKQLLMMVFT
jgi:hypothetical protein